MQVDLNFDPDDFNNLTIQINGETVTEENILGGIFKNFLADIKYTGHEYCGLGLQIYFERKDKPKDGQ